MHAALLLPVALHPFFQVPTQVYPFSCRTSGQPGLVLTLLFLTGATAVSVPALVEVYLVIFPSILGRLLSK